MPGAPGDGMAEERGKPLKLGAGDPASSTPDSLLKILYDPAGSSGPAQDAEVGTET